MRQFCDVAYWMLIEQSMTIPGVTLFQAIESVDASLMATEGEDGRAPVPDPDAGVAALNEMLGR